MADEYRVTIRLSPELYTQLQAHGSHGKPLAAIVRHALVSISLGSQERQSAR